LGVVSPQTCVFSRVGQAAGALKCLG
jgi:structural maintenance of chromosomes protein 5